MGRPWSYEAPEGISSEIDGGGKKLFDGKRKFCGGVKDNMQLQSIAFGTKGYVRSSSPYCPHGVPIFPKPPKITKQNKQTNKQQIKITT